MALSNLANCFLTTGYKNISPIIFGNTMANIIASEKPHTALMFAEAPITMKIKNNTL